MPVLNIAAVASFDSCIVNRNINLIVIKYIQVGVYLVTVVQVR